MAERAKTGRVHFHTANVLSLDELEAATCHFDLQKPVAIVHEGLFTYLTMDEKRQAALNFKSILQRFGGTWVTPDLSDRTSLYGFGSMFPDMFQAITGAMGCDIAGNAFESQGHMIDFFDDLGFKVEVRSQVDGSYELSTLKLAGRSHEQADLMLKRPKIYVLTLC